MTTSEKFSTFCSSLRMQATDVSNISSRTKQIAKRINTDFWNSNSETNNRLFVGSYGRGTDIHISDIDLIVVLPSNEYHKYNAYKVNGQSALLQSVKNSIANKYSTTHIGADGQVVQLNFTDGVQFEIVPAFNNKNGSFTYPDTNNGGSWKVTNPRAEIAAMTSFNYWNNLKKLCRMARAWKDNCNVSISGLLIDTLAYNFLNQWEYRDKSFAYYDWMCRDFFLWLINCNPKQMYWHAPGSGQHVFRTGSFEYKALRAYNITKEAIQYDDSGYDYTANQHWRQIFGSKFPSL